MDLTNLETKIKVQFKDRNLLQSALTHRSYLNENRKWPLAHNERLEFLGDAVLELITTEYLYRNFPNPEGELTNLRSALVNYKMLSEIASELGLDNYILLSKGEAKDTGRARQVILANAMEALIGAMYMDSGFEVTRGFITEFVIQQLEKILSDGKVLDPKSKFQELTQEKLGVTPNYKVLAEWGPDHNKNFEVGVFVNDRQIASGVGSSKQEGEIAAAENGLKVSDL
ncbi:MAG: ribonuclease III [Candidatus Doudnabacteria bacterium RIFCSPLOWO2_02_FULL_49_13]|uniref:Ribonuclease 3 n=1 Tax=Candidatus Doudnabacteria bacterium RIFCSPHIGHO2_12_FULL_48_16 TaxID=1817838 RepID=A0A1F5PKJ6_9BACT|nr:MAG: ribonuclease III [Candidatus Doudnabacteria bacterium RIFCSPHIGHO2_02_FULL_49_24]OGE88715.1 MAG: ribonuclease III [Candidatus Doudnabacteria bacterium RIFCSPHIGHO2_01_FULL_50_67]OGE90421.1 MAG: ribonuclease III [Candidatus Doudnabacteria bacterium RIFCSPHIGHO2_12_FULL_48_16]OGE97108.1 MAG: ribonuclease III [Candidatus Doudnabacteria bacterium RIFCSPLOWO2_01_FULL_49_40]OGF02462.1 MAG: ribonuclease III [Candidatus Doudnabacteria bacterium RIFCSPLOWO2_02_FULL_49_13]OGF03620.1 MAG: ribonuc